MTDLTEEVARPRRTRLVNFTIALFVIPPIWIWLCVFLSATHAPLWRIIASAAGAAIISGFTYRGIALSPNRSSEG